MPTPVYRRSSCWPPPRWTTARSERYGRAKPYSRTDSGVPGSHNDVVTAVTNKTVYVDVAC